MVRVGAQAYCLTKKITVGVSAEIRDKRDWIKDEYYVVVIDEVVKYSRSGSEPVSVFKGGHNGVASFLECIKP